MGFAEDFRRFFLRGLAALLPTLITLWLLVWVWNFLWEGADMRVEDSVRQSAYFGFHRTRQIVLDALVAEAGEISWIFTLDDG